MPTDPSISAVQRREDDRKIWKALRRVARLTARPEKGLILGSAGSLAPRHDSPGFHHEPEKNCCAESRSLFDPLGLALLVLAACVYIFVALYYCRSGIDLTDEGLYLIWIAMPWNYSSSVSQFGFIYHPIHLLADGNVALVRIANNLITLCLAWLASYASINKYFPNKVGPNWVLVAFSFVISTSSLLVTCFELAQSPSYNTLAFQAMLIGVVGVALADSTKIGIAVSGHALIGGSLWLAFMAKPTTVLAFGLVGSLYLLLSGKFRAYLFFLSVLAAFLLLAGSALVIDGSIDAFVKRILSGLELARILSGGNELGPVWRWDIFPLRGNSLYLLIVVTLLFAALTRMSVGKTGASKVARIVIAILFSVGSMAIVANLYALPIPAERFAGLFFIALPAGCLVAAIFNRENIRFKPSELVLAAALLILPHAYAFGTNRPYWVNAEGASFFWVLSGAVLAVATSANKKMWLPLFPISGAAVFLASLFLYTSIQHPMRQTQSLRLNADLVGFGKEGHQLSVSRDVADYIKSLRKSAVDGGFTSGTPVIDLTGGLPGVAYILNGTAPGVAWLIGGYPGSEAFAIAALDAVPCRVLSRAWVLFAPSGPRKLPDNLLKRYGVDLDQDYEILGTALRPPAFFPQSYTHYLLKPRRANAAALSACERSFQERAG